MARGSQTPGQLYSKQGMTMPEQNRDDTIAHLNLLFSRCAAECSETTFQLDRSEVDGKGWASHQFATTVEGVTNATQWAIDWNTAGQNIYVGANPRKAGLDPNKSATDKDVLCAFYSFGDWDSAESIEIANNGVPIAVTASVTTGTVPNRRVQPLWEHECPVYNLAAWTETQTGIADYFKGDRVIDPRRILRLAGCINYPTKAKRERGYIEETVTLHTEFDGERRGPVDTVAMHNEFAKRAGTPASEAPGDEAPKGGLGLPVTSPGVELKATMDAIQAGGWHNAVRDQIASWVAKGWAYDAIRLSCFAFTQPGFTHEQTAADVDTMIRGALEKGYAPDIKHKIELETATPAEPGTLTFKPMSDAPQEANVPMRHFIYGKHLIRGFVAATISPGGVGKTTLMMIEGIAIASGKPLLGIPVHDKGLNVLHCNLEDPIEELWRRYWAILRFFNLKHEDIGGKIYLHSGRDKKIILAELNETGQVVPTQDAEDLAAEITRLNIDVVQIDPMVKAHYVDENNNKHIDDLLTIAGAIANDTGSAIDFAQHVRKSPAGVTPIAGDINQARGASALSGAVRTARTLTTMTAKEAELFGMAIDKASWYVRVDDAKNNMSPPAANATWVERKSQYIHNGGITGSDGDNVGVMTPWSPPDALDGVSIKTINKTLKAIAEGPGEERYYTQNNQGKSNRYAGNVIKEVIEGEHVNVDLAPQQVKQILKDWMKSGLITEFTYDCDQTRKPEKGLKVDWSKQPGEVANV